MLSPSGDSKRVSMQPDIKSANRMLVIPAKAGIQCLFDSIGRGEKIKSLDSGFRRNDEKRRVVELIMAWQTEPISRRPRQNRRRQPKRFQSCRHAAP